MASKLDRAQASHTAGAFIYLGFMKMITQPGKKSLDKS